MRGTWTSPCLGDAVRSSCLWGPLSLNGDTPALGDWPASHSLTPSTVQGSLQCDPPTSAARTPSFSLYCLSLSPLHNSICPRSQAVILEPQALGLQEASPSLRAPTRSSESVGPHEDGESQYRTGPVAHEGVHGDHLEVQHVLPGARHRPGEDQHGADIVDLLQGTVEGGTCRLRQATCQDPAPASPPCPVS